MGRDRRRAGGRPGEVLERPAARPDGEGGQELREGLWAGGIARGGEGGDEFVADRRPRLARQQGRERARQPLAHLTQRPQRGQRGRRGAAFPRHEALEGLGQGPQPERAGHLRAELHVLGPGRGEQRTGRGGEVRGQRRGVDAGAHREEGAEHGTPRRFAGQRRGQHRPHRGFTKVGSEDADLLGRERSGQFPGEGGEARRRFPAAERKGGEHAVFDRQGPAGGRGEQGAGGVWVAFHCPAREVALELAFVTLPFTRRSPEGRGAEPGRDCHQARARAWHAAETIADRGAHRRMRVPGERAGDPQKHFLARRGREPGSLPARRRIGVRRERGQQFRGRRLHALERPKRGEAPVQRDRTVGGQAGEVRGERGRAPVGELEPSEAGDERVGLAEVR